MKLFFGYHIRTRYPKINSKKLHVSLRVGSQVKDIGLKLRGLKAWVQRKLGLKLGSFWLGWLKL